MLTVYIVINQFAQFRFTGSKICCISGV